MGWGRRLCRGKEMAGLEENRKFLLQTMRWSATVVAGAGSLGQTAVVADLQLGAASRSAWQAGGKSLFPKRPIQKSGI